MGVSFGIGAGGCAAAQSGSLCGETDVRRRVVGTPNATFRVGEPFETVVIKEVNLSREMPLL
jgi:hypothetical protein